MKKIFLFSLLFSFCAIFAQRQYDPMFGATVALDTLSNTNTTITTKKVIFKRPIEGMVTNYGWARLISGSDTTITVQARLILDRFTNDISPWYSLGSIADAAIAVGDTVKFVFPMAPQSFWTDCEGFQLKYSISATGTRQIEIKSVSKSR